MNHEFSRENLIELIEAARDDEEMIGMIEQCLITFGEYHSAIFQAEIWLKLYNHKNMARNDYQEKAADMSSRRTICHNAVLSSVNILNRMAKQHGIPAIYSGTVSEEVPYRREVANAILGYVESVILERR